MAFFLLNFGLILLYVYFCLKNLKKQDKNKMKEKINEMEEMFIKTAEEIVEEARNKDLGILENQE